MRLAGLCPGAPHDSPDVEGLLDSARHMHHSGLQAQQSCSAAICNTVPTWGLAAYHRPCACPTADARRGCWASVACWQRPPPPSAAPWSSPGSWLPALLPAHSPRQRVGCLAGCAACASCTVTVWLLQTAQHTRFVSDKTACKQAHTDAASPATGVKTCGARVATGWLAS